jgi:hypothetical protein
MGINSKLSNFKPRLKCWNVSKIKKDNSKAKKKKNKKKKKDLKAYSKTLLK